MQYVIECKIGGEVKKQVICDETLIHIELEELGMMIVPTEKERDAEYFTSLFDMYGVRTLTIFDKKVIEYPSGEWICKVSKGKFVVRQETPESISSLFTGDSNHLTIIDPNNDQCELTIRKK